MSDPTEPVEVAVDIPPKTAEKLDALATVYDAERDEIILEALRSHLSNMLERRQTLKVIANAYLDHDLTDDDLELLFGAQPGVELATHMRTAIEEEQAADDGEGEGDRADG